MLLGQGDLVCRECGESAGCCATTCSHFARRRLLRAGSGVPEGVEKRRSLKGLCLQAEESLSMRFEKGRLPSSCFDFSSSF